MLRPNSHFGPDRLQTKTARYDQVEAIAMAPHDGIGTFGWATLGELKASLPATVQDLIASYSGSNPIPLSSGRLIDVAMTLIFAALFGVSRWKGREPTSKELLERLFPPKKSRKKNSDDVVII
jgi:hypothetical protein